MRGGGAKLQEMEWTHEKRFTAGYVKTKASECESKEKRLDRRKDDKSGKY